MHTATQAHVDGMLVLERVNDILHCRASHHVSANWNLVLPNPHEIGHGAQNNYRARHLSQVYHTACQRPPAQLTQISHHELRQERTAFLKSKRLTQLHGFCSEVKSWAPSETGHQANAWAQSETRPIIPRARAEIPTRFITLAFTEAFDAWILVGKCWFNMTLYLLLPNNKPFAPNCLP